MADFTLSNIASVQGSYNDITTAMDSTAVATLIVDGLSITKSADLEVWVTGYLTYTVVIANTAEYDYVDPVLTDIIDPSVATLVNDSVMVDGTATTDYTYDGASGTLVVTLDTILVNGSVTVTFQVQRV